MSQLELQIVIGGSIFIGIVILKWIFFDPWIERLVKRRLQEELEEPSVEQFVADIFTDPLQFYKPKERKRHES